MNLFRLALARPNPFPHGLFWTGMRGAPVLPAVAELIEAAVARGVRAAYVEVDTFDALMLRMWRNLPSRPSDLEAKVRKSLPAAVSIDVPSHGSMPPLLRLNAVPIAVLPRRALEVRPRQDIDWTTLRSIQSEAEIRILVTKAPNILCWGDPDAVAKAFAKHDAQIEGVDISSDLTASDALPLKGFVEEGLATALARSRPLLLRRRSNSPILIADAHAQDTGAPADYGAVPKLGPPLPGDLGRPILSAQKTGEPIPVPAMAPPPADPRQAAREQARQRALEERQAAEGSRLFLGGNVTAAESAAGDNLPAIAEPAKPGDTRSAARKAFLAGGPEGAIESAERIVLPSSPAIIQAGTVIPAALITGIRSDLPGQISAQVIQNIYDSPTGRILLIPQGARLVGEYDSEVAAGQRRVLLAWDRLILPGGRSIRLDRQPGTDAAGNAGLQDRVNDHWGRMLRAALISSLLGVGTEVGSDRDSEVVRALRSGTQDGIGETGRRVVERELSVAPTLTIRPGFAFRVFVSRDLVFEDQGRRP